MEVSEQVFIQAAKMGVAPEHLVTTLIEQRLTSLDSAQQVDQVIAETARIKFESHFGMLNSETALSVDN